MLTPRNIEWIAAFLEGEGSFFDYGGPRVSAVQKQATPERRLRYVHTVHVRRVARALLSAI